MEVAEDLAAALEVAKASTAAEISEIVQNIYAKASGDVVGHAIRQACNSLCSIPGSANKEQAISDALQDIRRVERLS